MLLSNIKLYLNKLATLSKRRFIDEDRLRNLDLPEKKKVLILTLDDIDRKLIDIQQSTKTTFPNMVGTHNFLRMRSKWYYNWHIKSFSSLVHVATLALWTLFCGFLLFLNISQPINTAKAADFTCSFNGSISNNWNNASNWDNCNSEYPGQAARSYDVTIPAGKTVTLNINNLDITNSGTIGGNITIAATGSLSTNANNITFLNMNNSGTLTTTSTETLSIKGSWDSSAGIFTSGSSTAKFTSSITGNTIKPKSSGNSFFNLTFDGPGGAWTTSTNAMVVAGSLNITIGTFNIADKNLSVAGNITCTGTLNASSNGNITITGNAAVVNFSSGIFIKGTTGILLFSRSGTNIFTLNPGASDFGIVKVYPSGGTFGSINTLDITDASTFIATSLEIRMSFSAVWGKIDISNSILVLTGTGTPLTLAAGNLLSMTTTNSTVTYTGSGTTNVTAFTTGYGNYNNLTFTPASAATYNLTAAQSGTTGITGALTINANATFDPKTYNLTVSGAFVNNGNFGITGTDPSGIHIFSSTWSNNSGANFYVSTNTTNTSIASTFANSGTVITSGTGANLSFLPNSPANSGNITFTSYASAILAKTYSELTLSSSGGFITGSTTTDALSNSGVLTINNYYFSANSIYGSGYLTTTASGGNLDLPENAGSVLFYNAASSLPARTYTNLQLYAGGILTGTTTAAYLSNAGGTLSIGSYTLNITASVTNNNTITIDDGTLTVDGNITTGTLTCTGSSTINIYGNWTNNGVFEASISTVNFNGTTTISGTSTNTFYNVVVSGTLIASTGNIYVAKNWTKSEAGIFIAGSGIVTFNSQNTTTILGNNTFNNLIFDTSSGPKRINIEAGSSQNLGGLTFDTNSGNILDLRSTSSPTKYSFIIPNDITNVNYVNAEDSIVVGKTITTGAGSIITNCVNWVALSSVSGYLYNSMGGSYIIGPKTVSLLVNGTISGTAESSNGSFTITPSSPFAANDVLTIYIDGETEKASTITIISAPENFTSINLYQNYTTLRQEADMPSITNTNLASGDDTGGSDLLYSVNGSNTATFTQNLYIYSSKTYAPAGNIVLQGNLVNDGIFVANSDTITFDGSSKTISGTNAINLYNVTVNADKSITDNKGITIAGTIFTINGTFTVGGTKTTTFNNANQSLIVGINGILNGTNIANSIFKFVGDYTPTLSSTGSLGVNLYVQFYMPNNTDAYRIPCRHFEGKVEMYAYQTSYGISTFTSTCSYPNVLDIDGDLSLYINSPSPYGYLNFQDVGTIPDGDDVSFDTIRIGGNFTRTVAGSGRIQYTKGAVYYNSSGISKINFDGTGTQTFDPGETSTFGNVAYSGSGTFNIVNSSTINGNLILKSGTFSPGRDISVSGDWTNSGGTFIPGTYKVTFTGDSSYINGTASSQTFYSINVAKNYDQTLIVSSTTLNVTNITLSTGYFTPGTNTYITGDWIANTTNTINNGTITFIGNTKVSGTIKLAYFNNIIITGILTGITNGKMIIAGNWTNNGTYNHNSGYVNFIDSSGSKTIDTGGSAFYNLRLFSNRNKQYSAVNNTMTVMNDLRIDGSAVLNNSSGNADIVVNGTVSGSSSASIDLNTNTFTNRVSSVKNFGTISESGNWTFNNLNLENSSGVPVTITTASGGTGQIAVNGTLNIGQAGDTYPPITLDNETNDRNLDINNLNIVPGSALLASSAASFTLSGSWTNSGTFTANSGTVTFDGDTAITGSSINTFNNLTISRSLTAPNTNVNISGNWDNQGSFTANSSTINFISNNNTNLYGNNNFYNLKINSDASVSGRSINFSANTTQTITHALELKGSIAKKLTLSCPGTKDYWRLYLQNGATQAVSYIIAKNADASSGNPIHAGITSRGDHTKNWLFTENPIITFTKSPYVFGQWTTNTQPLISFILYDPDIQSSIGRNQRLQYRIQITTNANFSNLILDYISSFAPDGIHTQYSVGQSFDQNEQSGIYNVGMKNQRLTDGLYYWRIKSLDSDGGDSGWQTLSDPNSAIIKIGNSPTAGLFNSKTSTIISDKKDIKNDDTDFATITVTIKDSKDNPIKNKDINLTSSRQNDKIRPIGNPSITNKYYALSDESGKAIFKISSNDSGESTLTATNMTDSQSLYNEITIHFNSTLSAAGDAIISTVANIITNETTKNIANKVLKPASQAAVAAGGFAILVQGVAALPQIFQFIAYLFALILESLGIRRRPKSWGVVFDSITGKPQELSVVRLFESESKRLIATRVTDLSGRFGFSVEQGNYVVSVTKPGYIFPITRNSMSNLTRSQSHYVGATIAIDQKVDNLTLSIPIEPVKTKMSFASKSRILARDISEWISASSVYIFVPIFIVGIIVYGIMAYITGETKNYIMMDSYIVMAGFYILQKVRSSRHYGLVITTVNGSRKLKIIPNATVYLFDTEFETLRGEVQTNKNGQFMHYVPKGRYYLNCKAEGYQMEQNMEIINNAQSHSGKYYKGGIIELKQPGYINVAIKMNTI